MERPGAKVWAEWKRRRSLNFLILRWGIVLVWGGALRTPIPAGSVPPAAYQLSSGRPPPLYVGQRRGLRAPLCPSGELTQTATPPSRPAPGAKTQRARRPGPGSRPPAPPYPSPPPPAARGALTSAPPGGQPAGAAMGRAACGLLWLLLGSAAAQYEKYSFRGFPPEDLMPLAAAYGHALEQYEGESWRESARYLEAALRLHRLLRDSEAFCHANCSGPAPPVGSPSGPALGPDGGPGDEWARELQLFGHVLERAACLRRCKRTLPAFQVPYPPRQLLRDFQSRLPYQYLHYALFKVGLAPPSRPAPPPLGPSAPPVPESSPQPPPRLLPSTTPTPHPRPQLGCLLHPGAPALWGRVVRSWGRFLAGRKQSRPHDPGQSSPLMRSGLRAQALPTHSVPAPQANRLEKAAAAAYTFLQKNPKHELTAKYLSYYRGLLDAAEEPLTDLEAQPYEVGWRA